MRDSLEQAHETALRTLERRRRTRRELERRLQDKNFAPEIITETLDRLERVGLVDDLEYARAFLRERLGKRSIGERLARRQLGARGISREVADQVMEEMAEGEGQGSISVATEAQRASRALEQLWPRYARLDRYERRQKLSAALSRRGFEYQLISDLLMEREREGG